MLNKNSQSLSNLFNNSLKSFFTLNKSEQKGIVILFIIILLISIFNVFQPFKAEEKPNDFSKLSSEIAQFRLANKVYNDSVIFRRKQATGRLSDEEAKKFFKPIDFNPNTAAKSIWIEIGFSEKQFKTIKKYLDKGGGFYRKEDLKKMYCISDAEYEIVEEFIKIDKHEILKGEKRPGKKQYSPKKYSRKAILTPFVITEINSANSNILINNLRLKPKLAKRIIKFRNALGGYYKTDQLLEVYGFPSYYYDKIRKYISVDTSLIEKININAVGFKTLLKHPYFDYESTKIIFDAKSKSKIKQLTGYEDFIMKTSFNDSIADKMKHYLYFGRPK